MTAETLIRPAPAQAPPWMRWPYPLAAVVPARQETVARDARDFVKMYCHLHGAPEEVREEATLSASELATNAALYARFPPGRRLIVVRCALAPGHLVLRVYDPDPTVPVACVFDADELMADPDLNCSAHAGAAIVDALADYFGYHVTPRGKFAEAGFTCKRSSRPHFAEKFPNNDGRNHLT